MTLYMCNPVKAARPAMAERELGYIDTPAQGNIRPAGVIWCADNGCFGKGWPGYEAWLEWLMEESHAAADCWFATAPDVVGDAQATLERSLPWLSAIRELGYPAALVAQNGMTVETTPWSEFDTLFLGGSSECEPCGYVRPAEELVCVECGHAELPAQGRVCECGGKMKPRMKCPSCEAKLTEWKLSEAAATLTAAAKAKGKKVHMGRVNSRKRYMYAKSIGCDSADGTYLVFGPDANLPKLLSWVREGQEELPAAA